jgi:hypothetical protein
MTGNNERLSILVRNYDDMTNDGKKELLSIGEKYLIKKDDKEKLLFTAP